MDDEILQKLKDIHLPPKPSWWPPAMGFFLLLIIILLLVALIIFIFYFRRPKRLLHKQLKVEISDIEKQFAKNNSGIFVQSRISSILRRLLAKKDPQLVTREFNDLHAELGAIFRGHKKLNEFINLLTIDRFKKESSVDGARLIAVFKELVKKCGT